VQKVVRLFELDGAVGSPISARRLGLDEIVLTRAFTGWARRSGSTGRRPMPRASSSSDPWERLLIAGLARDFQQLRLEFLGRGGAGDPQALVESWLAGQCRPVAQFKAVVDRARQVPNPTAAMLAQQRERGWINT
jgi:glutamate dehydrogenase